VSTDATGPQPANDYARRKALFLELFELAGLARSQRLAELAQTEPALAQELAQQLQASAQPLPALDAADRRQHVSDAGPRIASYRVLQRIGRGGMGEVWRADRVEGGFRQEAAIKLMRSFGESARFEAERAILARLEHPHIARLLDGGTLADGQPWLALEFVRGSDLVAHADAARLPLRSRIELFLDVCAAVASAHRLLVVHRDLKPSNILVDPDGRPRVMDFGIAARVADTSDGRIIGTPGYMSPEAARGQPPTPQMDVFAAGMVLAELLCGLHALDGGTLTIAGRALPARPRAFVEAGVARIPEDRHAVGVVGDLPLWENAVLERYASPAFSRHGIVRRELALAHAKSLVERFDVRGTESAGLATITRSLSGGNMQKLILGRELSGAVPKLIVANQPTWGLDIGAVAYVHQQLLDAAAAGAAVVLVSEDLDEIFALADRIAVIHHGVLGAPRPARDWSLADIGLAMAGAAHAA